MSGDCDIAIVGVGCRFPGADNVEEFWRLLVNGENHVTDIPTERWNTDAFYSEDKDAAGKIYVKKAGLIKNYDTFDPRPFGIGDAEAERIDPQQRHVLECVHMAFEDGGITRKTVNGSSTGVYIGIMNDDYKSLFTGHHVYDTSYSATGVSSTIIAARVSYVFNLQGPCLALDTACSSALTAVHLGAQAILAGDCEMAVCGGVSNIVSPETFIPLCRAKMMSAVGQCQTFCDTADGYARGEGCGIVILKKLSQAINDGNKIWAIVKTGSNQDGRTAQPITSPSAEQQFKLLNMLYTTSGTDPSSIQYIEAHGTGTRAGDPVETNTLGRFFSQNRNNDSKRKGKLLVGSVKTNIGHTESAAGVAGLIKVLLMMKHGIIVPSLHIKKDKSNLNPAIRLNDYNLDIPVVVEKWDPNQNGDRIGCVNSFGFGGSNGHAILTHKRSFSCDQDETVDVAQKANRFVAVSSASFEGLKPTLDNFKKQITESTEASLDSISFTSTCHRDHFPYRVCFAVDSLMDLTNQATRHIPQNKRPTMPLNLVFVYCGVGTTWKGMCSQLIKFDRTFRDGVIEVDKYLRPLANISMEQLFSDPNADYSDPFLNHIAIFATQIGLTFMWRNLGIQPTVVVGQSVGEVAAAYASGSLDLKTAVDVIYHRSNILASQTGGSMMVVKNLSVEALETLCDHYDRKVTIAVYSSPVACTLSGETDVMTKIKAHVLKYSKEQNINVFMKELDVGCAYHSHMVDQCMHEIRQKLKPSVDRTRTVPVVSTVTGRKAISDELQSAEYWAQNIRKPVLMNEAILYSLKDKHKNVLLEIGPKPVLRAHINDILQADTTVCLSSMTYSKELPTRSATIVELFENGADIEWKREVKVSPLCSIPAYTFDRRQLLFIPEEEKRKYQGLQSVSSIDHRFLRSSMTHGKEFQLVIGKSTTPYVFEHFMGGALLVPGATYVEAVFAIGLRKLQLPIADLSVSVELVSMHTPSDEKDSEIDCDVKLQDTEIRIKFSKGNRLFSSGKAKKADCLYKKTVPVSQLLESYNKVFMKSDVYAALEDLGFKYGSSLRLIERVWYSDTDCLAEIHVPANIVEEFNNTHIHPAVVDSIFQIFGVFARRTGSNDGPVFPKGLDSMTVQGYPKQRMFCYTAKARTVGRQTYYNAILLDVAGGVICEINDFYTQAISSNLEEEGSNRYSLVWREVKSVKAISNMPSLTLNVLIFGSEKTKHFFEESFENIADDFALLNFNLPGTQINENQVLEFTKKKRYHAVIFAPFTTIPLTQKHNELMYQNSKWNILCLKNLILALSRSSVRVPLFVMTDNSQQTKENKGTLPNLCGAELWGMVRCAQQESLYPDIRLLDVDVSNCDRNTLHKVISDNFPTEKELQIEGNSVWKTRLTQETLLHEIKCKKTLHIEEGNIAKLKTAQPDEIASPFFELVDFSVNTVPLSPNSARIRLCQPCLHDTAIFPVTSCSLDQKHLLWPRMSAEGFTPYCVEGEGLLVNEHASKTELATGNKIYFCYPVSIATYVDVPTECMFMPSEIPSYVPGILTLSVVLLNSTACIPKGSALTVLFDESVQCCQTFVENFLETCCESCVHCLYKTSIVEGTLHHENAKLKSTKGIIVLSKLNRDIIETLLACIPSLKYLITLSVFLPTSVRHRIATMYPKLAFVELCSDQIFQSNNLIQRMPALRNVLRQCRGKTRVNQDLKLDDSAKYENPLALPSKTLTLVDNKRGLALSVSATQMFRKDCCYIVVGGLTGLGWIVMTFIAENGGGFLGSIARRKPSKHQQNEIENLMNKTQCKIKAYQADITDMSNLSNAIQCIEHDLNGWRIKGLFNGAGVLADALLINMSEQQLEEVLKPKILGSLNLHLATQHMDLDFFVMQSSVVSIIGNSGQCNYGAANSFMDALAHYRRSQQLNGQSINWGPLSVGMAQQSSEVKLRLQQMGMSMLNEEEIYSLFRDTLASDRCQTTIGSFNWSTVGKSLQSVKLKDLVPLEVKESQYENEMFNMFDAETFQQLTNDEKENVLFKHTIQVLCSVLTITDTAVLTPELQIGELGIESFAAMSFVNKLFDLTGCRVPIQMILSDKETLHDIVLFVRDDMDQSKQENAQVGLILEPDAKLTFIESAILLDYARSRSKANFVKVVDFAVELNEWGLDSWKKILRHVVIMNPELCRKFIVTTTGIEVQQVPDDDVDVKVEIVPVEEIGNNDPRHRLHFSLEDELPIKFQIAFDSLCTNIRIILHRVVEDLRTQAFINNDIRSVATAVIQGQTMPKKHERSEVPRVLHSAVNRRYDSLKQFWSEQLRDVNEIVSLNNTEVTDVLDAKSFKISEFKFQKEEVERIMAFILKHKLTLFQFFISVHQLFLHGETNSKIIPVLSVADMRIHDERLRNAFGRCINYVPFVASIREDNSILDFFLANSKTVSSTTEHSLYPYDMILEEIRTPSIRKHIRRHTMFIDNMTELEQLLQTSEHKISMKKMWLTAKEYETFLRILYDVQSKTINGAFGYNQQVCNETRGKNMLTDFMALVEKCICNYDKPISSVLKGIDSQIAMGSQTLVREEHFQEDCRDDIDSKVALSLDNSTYSVQVGDTVVQPIGIGDTLSTDADITMGKSQKVNQNMVILRTGTARKQTRHGRDHTILLTLRRKGDQEVFKQLDKYAFEWTRAGNKRVRRLPLSCVHGVQCWERLYGYPSFVILTKKRKYVMKMETLEEAEEWMEVFQSAIGGSESTKL